jgi:hypothetical protein
MMVVVGFFVMRGEKDSKRISFPFSFLPLFHQELLMNRQVAGRR